MLSELKRLAHRVHKSKAHAGDFARGMTAFHQAIDAVFAHPEDPLVALAEREKIIAEILRLQALAKAD